MQVTYAEFLNDSERIRTEAGDGPVTVMQDGIPQFVVLSTEEYERLKRGTRRAFFVDEMSEADIALIENYEVGTENAHLNEELEGWQP